jgi:hypothetical protein
MIIYEGHSLNTRNILYLFRETVLSGTWYRIVAVMVNGSAFRLSAQLGLREADSALESISATVSELQVKGGIKAL